MNAKLRVAMLSIPVVMLSACTTMGASSSVAADRAAMSDEERYVAEVERLARTRGIDVVWVNQPAAKAEWVATSDD